MPGKQKVTGVNSPEIEAFISTVERLDEQAKGALANVEKLSVLAESLEKQAGGSNKNSLLETIKFLIAIGFDFPDYLEAMGIAGDIVVCIDEDSWTRTAPVCALFYHNNFVRSMVSDFLTINGTELNYPAPSYYGVMSTKKAAGFAFNSKQTVFLLGEDIAAALFGQLKDSGARCIDADGFTRTLHYFTFFYGGIYDLSKRVPGLQCIFMDLPVFPADKEKQSELEQRIVAEEISFSKIRAALRKSNNTELITSGFEGLDYDSPADVAELLNVIPQKPDAQGVLEMEDYQSPFRNARGGIRITPDVPADAERTVFILGGCRMMGYGAPDWGTPAACLQKLFNEHGLKIAVENHAYLTAKRYQNYSGIVKRLPAKPGDILICGNAYNSNRAKAFGLDWPYIDMINLFERPHPYGEVFFDKGHYNERGNAAIAAKIFEALSARDFMRDDQAMELRQKWSGTPGAQGRMRQASTAAQYGQALQDYLETLKPYRKPISAIVMNCNPFTLGHRYLVEYAAERSSQLFLFVVEEDKSEFKFADRIELVRKGTADLRNVTVLPSGNFIISSLTFVDYFGKAELQDKQIDPSNDVRIFCEGIAPALGITSRYVGEEPFDKITLQYNQSMARILPEYGMELVEIPRKQGEGTAISASRVRELLKVRDFSAIADMVPPSTLEFLKAEYGE
jgi:[citrate (pro-3S)-lyase] ligase